MQWIGTTDETPLSLMRLILQRLSFVVNDTEDDRVVYTVFAVLNSRGLDVDWLDKTKSVLMSKMYEQSTTPQAADAEVDNLQKICGHIHQEIAREKIPGDEILRITATLFHGTAQGKARSAEASLDVFKEKSTDFSAPGRISERLLYTARSLVQIYANPYLKPVHIPFRRDYLP